jgi:hypothetical protein
MCIPTCARTHSLYCVLFSVLSPTYLPEILSLFPIFCFRRMGIADFGNLQNPFFLLKLLF